ncbi:glycogen debranching enzyme GlgX, partial [Streptomyces sp. SID10244]|nr:glycogen debranching enzyme GlgX [Streptomyces sp. SID10244]
MESPKVAVTESPAPDAGGSRPAQPAEVTNVPDPFDLAAPPDDREPFIVWPGSAYPLGATYDGVGTNFSLFSEVATAVDLCLIDDAGTERRIRLE